MNGTHTHGSPRRSHLASVVCVMLLATPCMLAAQQPAAPGASAGERQIPRPDELEPGVNTTPSSSASAPSAAAPAAASPRSAPGAAPPPAAAAAPAASASGASSAAGASAGAAKAGPRQNQKEASAKAGARKGPDRLELDTTDITGNRELPKVLYIVPWKRSDLGDVVGKPVNSLLDEVLQPLDRDVFRRENRYYDALQGGAGDGKPGAAQGSPNKP